MLVQSSAKASNHHIFIFYHTTPRYLKSTQSKQQQDCLKKTKHNIKDKYRPDSKKIRGHIRTVDVNNKGVHKK